MAFFSRVHDMNQDDFESKLTEVAHWCIEPLSISGNSKCLPKINNDYVEDDRWDYDEEDEDDIDIEEEPIGTGCKTIRIQQLKEQPCSDCGKLVVDRKINIRLTNLPKTHFRGKCSICSNYVFWERDILNYMKKTDEK